MSGVRIGLMSIATATSGGSRIPLMGLALMVSGPRMIVKPTITASMGDMARANREEAMMTVSAGENEESLLCCCYDRVADQ